MLVLVPVLFSRVVCCFLVLCDHARAVTAVSVLVLFSRSVCMLCARVVCVCVCVCVRDANVLVM